MPVVIKVKKSETALSKPTASDIAIGEIALNAKDQRIFVRDANGDIITINTAPAEIHIFNPANPIPQPNTGDFIMFAKNRVVNTSGIIGYYADIKLVNHTTKKAEMFAISSGIIESSK